jgi:hypothetical protein
MEISEQRERHAAMAIHRSLVEEPGIEVDHSPTTLETNELDFKDAKVI